MDGDIKFSEGKDQRAEGPNGARKMKMKMSVGKSFKRVESDESLSLVSQTCCGKQEINTLICRLADKGCW